MAETALAIPHLEVGLVCDPGTSYAGIYGLTDLFNYAGQFAAKRNRHEDRPPVRVTQWREHEAGEEVRCVYDSWSNAPHQIAVLVLPGNEQATLAGASDSSMIRWLRAQHSKGVVLAAVCGGVFVLAGMKHAMARRGEPKKPGDQLFCSGSKVRW